MERDRAPVGRLFGVGVGPGDPDLLTLKAVAILSRVPVVAYPAPVGGESSARAIASPYLGSSAHRGSSIIEIAIEIPMRPGEIPAEPYERGADRIASELDQGRDVAILCEGDPLFYGTFIYLLERLEDWYPCTIVPGVTSLTACAAAASLALVRRNEILMVLPGTLNSDALTTRLYNSGALAILKVGRHVQRLKSVLESGGRLEGAMLVEHATRAQERIRPLSDCGEQTVPYFSMILVPAPDLEEGRS